MKTKLFFTVALLAIGFLSIQAQNSDMFEKLSNHRDVTSVYISRTLLRMMSNFDVGGADVRSLAGRLEQIEIHNSNGNAEANRIIREGMEQLEKSDDYELLLRIRDGNSGNIVFYAKKEDEYFRDLIMHIEEANNSTIIRIMGAFTAEDIQGVMDSKKGN